MDIDSSSILVKMKHLGGMQAVICHSFEVRFLEDVDSATSLTSVALLLYSGNPAASILGRDSRLILARIGFFHVTLIRGPLSFRHVCSRFLTFLYVYYLVTTRYRETISTSSQLLGLTHFLIFNALYC